MTAAVQRIGDLFGSRYELFLRVSLLLGDKFNCRIKDVLCSLLATPFPPKALRSTYERARQILEAHVYGQELLTIMDCARVYQDGDRFKIDWESVGLLSEVHMKDWSKVVRYVTSNIRFVYCLEYVKEAAKHLYSGSQPYLVSPCGIFNCVRANWKAPASSTSLRARLSTPSIRRWTAA